jgi:predicted chitinase
MYEIITPSEAGSDYDRSVQRARNLPSGFNPSTITRAAYMSTRPVQILTKAAGMDNGAANSAKGGLTGDGARFRGRGFLQITGRRNYKGYSSYRGQDFTSSDTSADLLASNDANACDASGFYWTREKINREADAGATPSQITRVGGAINRGNASRIPIHDMDRQNAFNSIWPKLNDAL